MYRGRGSRGRSRGKKRGRGRGRGSQKNVSSLFSSSKPSVTATTIEDPDPSENRSEPKPRRRKIERFNMIDEAEHESEAAILQLSQKSRKIRMKNKESKVICTICNTKILRKSPIAQCKYCWNMTHLQCIQSWAKNCLSNTKQMSHQDPRFGREGFWYCPKCKVKQEKNTIPQAALCFCGKDDHPIDLHFQDPHSCGEICGKQLSPPCIHTCKDICHPGPCAPCAAIVPKLCFCGKTSRQQRCRSSPRSCGKPCGKLLKCSRHRCEIPCHEGECPPCGQETKLPCLCGRTLVRSPCGSQNVPRCEQPCGRLLSCKKCTCNQICHAPPCEPCPGNGKQECYCGKTKLTLRCGETSKSCGSECGKKLDCGRHYCSDPCHPGPCRPCTQVSQVPCRCGRKRRKLECNSPEWTCRTKCGKLLDCGKHKCQKRCCNGCDPCEKICGLRLNCGKHSCSLRCHPGPCRPCSLPDKISCFCGGTFHEIVCGTPSLPVLCMLPCKKPSRCHHKPLPHNCHEGPCPVCEQPCGKIHKKCGHACIVPCHSRKNRIRKPKGSKSDSSKKSGIWDERAKDAVAKKMKNRCPPCEVNVLRFCRGYHSKIEVACIGDKSPTCSLPCNQLLSCGVHRCRKPCHSSGRLENEKRELGEDIFAEGRLLGELEDCDICDLDCEKKLPCGHDCPRKCHTGECGPCREGGSVWCFCGKILSFQTCKDSENGLSLEPSSCGKICGNLLPCKHPCEEICHPGECTGPCDATVVVKCFCGKRKETWTCATYQRQLSLKNISKFNIQCTEECKKRKKKKKKQQKPLGKDAQPKEQGKDNEVKNSEKLKAKEKEKPKVLVKFDKKKREKKPIISPVHMIIGIVIIAVLLRVLMTLFT